MNQVIVGKFPACTMYILWWGSNPEIDGFTASLERSKWVGETDCRPKDCNDSTNNRKNSDPEYLLCHNRHSGKVNKQTLVFEKCRYINYQHVLLIYRTPYLANLGDGSIGIVLNPVCYSTLWSPISQSEEKELCKSTVETGWQWQLLTDHSKFEFQTLL